ncbi:MAG: GerW family sporulation protein [Limnochordales bacterium]
MSEQHPIEGLMQTAMESLKAMVDVNTILGDPVETPDGTVVVPVSKVSFGFAAGGTEFEAENGGDEGYPFGGGSGAGISLQPVAFLVVGQGQIRLMTIDKNAAIYDRLLDLAPDVMDGLQNIFSNGRGRSDQTATPLTP